MFDIEPKVFFGGEFLPAKATILETIPVQATVTREGHDCLGVEVVLVDPTHKEFSRSAMREVWPGLDRYEGSIQANDVGLWSFHIESFDDSFHTWEHDCGIKIRAGIDTELSFQMGVEVFESIKKIHKNQLSKNETLLLTQVITAISDSEVEPVKRLEIATSPQIFALIAAHPSRRSIYKSESYPLSVESKSALFGSWYEFFPRSEGATRGKDGEIISGTFKTALHSLERVAKMGFDILYLPPIHPIGIKFRKGKNNSLETRPSDPGVPWAIGNSDGGHDAINPDLGSEKDFDALVKAASKLNIRVALDFALQVSPDHPWVKTHPEWFTIRPDGSIAYAENPPKKYQDIYPINFEKDYEGLKREVVRVLRHWIARGVTIFRVDNPHTKPVYFWKDVISEINQKNPEVIFLSEAFTRPAMMYALGIAGFQQSYTYFTWRTSKEELIEYGTELAEKTSAYFRPNFWVNTPDILPFHLQNGNPAMFALRALLASTLSPSWGMYAGYELFEHTKLKEGAEEYRDSEKYEIKIRDWAGAEKTGMTLAPFISTLNRIRKENLALQQLRNLKFHPTDSPAIIAYSKREGENLILVVVNLDPVKVQETTVHWNLFYLGISTTEFRAKDLLNDLDLNWSEHTFVRLDPSRPHGHVGHIAKVLL